MQEDVGAEDQVPEDAVEPVHLGPREVAVDKEEAWESATSEVDKEEDWHMAGDSALQKFLQQMEEEVDQEVQMEMERAGACQDCHDLSKCDDDDLSC